ncbi:MAG: hypothetical protein HQ580_10325 [Planctomycetes bacterium]|nr:hypothetical protein [Planctomycetota bacterium]
MVKQAETMIRIICMSITMAPAILAGCAAPQSFYVFKEQSHTDWRASISNWRTNACISVEYMEGISGGGFRDFAQSFVPHCKKIEAVELATYPVNAAGWIRVCIFKDEEKKPGKELARCWLRIEENCPIPHGGYVTYDIPNVRVKPEIMYWVTFNELADEEYVGQNSTGSVTNTGFSRDNTYDEGKLMVGSLRGIHENGDVKFRIIAKCDVVPTLRKASSDEQESLPEYDFQNASWENASTKWNKYVLKKLEKQQTYPENIKIQR